MKPYEVYFKVNRVNEMRETIDSGVEIGCFNEKCRYNAITINLPLLWRKYGHRLEICEDILTENVLDIGEFKRMFIETYSHEMLHHLIDEELRRMRFKSTDDYEEGVLELMGY